MSIHFNKNNKIRETSGILAGVGGKVREVKEVYAGRNGKPELVWKRDRKAKFILYDRGNTFIYTNDMKTWETGHFTTDAFSIGSQNKIGYNGDIFAIVGKSGNEAVSYYSKDGYNWNQGAMPSDIGAATTGSFFTKCVYGNGRFLTTISTGYSCYSLDGIEWKKGCNIINDSVISRFGLCFAKDRFYAYNKYTYDGINFSDLGVSVGSRSDIIFVNNLYYGINSTGQSFRSSNGINWTSYDYNYPSKVNNGLPTYYGEAFPKLMYDGNQFLCCCKDQNYWYLYGSTNIANWTKIRDLMEVSDVVFYDGKIYMLSYSGLYTINGDIATGSIEKVLDISGYYNIFCLDE